MRRLHRSLLLLLAVAAALPATGAAAPPPRAGATFEVHDHSVRGSNWHVSLEIAKAGGALRNVVVYAEECDVTGFEATVPLGDDGTFTVVRDTWALTGRFTDADHLEGSWRVVKGACDTGVRAYAATSDKAQAGHDHGSHHHHDGHTYGHAMGTMPDLSIATPAQLRRTKRIWRRTLAASRRKPFNSYRNALRAGYKRYNLKWRRPLPFHLRKPSLHRDRRYLDPSAPESLVYWWPRKGRPILIGFMYRAGLGRPPGGPLFAWHRHFESGKGGDNQMTHVWLTGGLRSALANCLPVKQLEIAIPRFRFETPGQGSSHESEPCA